MWVEILSRHHHDVTARHRVGDAPIRIGRGYDNDVVLDDPFVAAHHLQLQRTPEGGWEAVDLGSVNGIRSDRGKARLDRVALDDERIIRIGHTLLRLRSAAHPVAAERVDTRQLPLWPAAILLLAAIVGIELTSDWLGETNDFQLTNYLAALEPMGELAVLWIGLWTILCRVFTGQARFERHLVIPLAGVLAYSVTDEILKFLGFAFSWPTLTGNEYIALCVLAGLVIFGHLQQIAPRRWRVSGSVMVGLTVLAVFAEALSINEARRNVDPPPLQGRFYPPALRLAAPQPDSRYFGEVARLRDKLSAGRKDGDR